MPRNGSGTYSLPAGNPVVTGTTISSTTHNNTMSDVATALTNSLAKDGQTTPTANLPLGGFKFTGMGTGSASTDSATLGQIQAQAYLYLASVSGTDTITASTSPVTAAYAAGQTFRFVAAATNTGAVTININSLGAKSITKNGTTALAAGDITSGAAYQITYDGTQFQITNLYTPTSALITSQAAETAPAVDDLLLLSDTSESAALNKITLENLLKVINGLTEDTAPDSGADYLLSYDASASAVKKVLFGRGGQWTYLAEQATTSGTSWSFTGIPSWATEVEIELIGFSTNSTSNYLVQIGDSGGLETTSYLGASSGMGGAVGSTAFTTGFGISAGAGTVVTHGKMNISWESGNTWVAVGWFARSDSAGTVLSAGSKSLSATLDRVALTTVNGTDTGDAGVARVRYR
jgi:hypothetical protein